MINSFLHRKHATNQYLTMTDDVNIQQEMHHWIVLPLWHSKLCDVIDKTKWCFNKQPPNNHIRINYIFKFRVKRQQREGTIAFPQTQQKHTCVYHP